jgi:hypothetical protein
MVGGSNQVVMHHELRLEHLRGNVLTNLDLPLMVTMLVRLLKPELDRERVAIVVA